VAINVFAMVCVWIAVVSLVTVDVYVTILGGDARYPIPKNAIEAITIPAIVVIHVLPFEILVTKWCLF
jgi:hypothetical protein